MKVAVTAFLLAKGNVNVNHFLIKNSQDTKAPIKKPEI